MTVVHARLRALDTAGVPGRTGSLSRAALVVMFLQELAYQLLAPPVQFPFELAVAHLSGFAGGEEGFGIREDSIGRRAWKIDAADAGSRLLHVDCTFLGIPSPQPSQVSLPKAPYQNAARMSRGERARRGPAPAGSGGGPKRGGGGARRILSPLKTHWRRSVLGHKPL